VWGNLLASPVCLFALVAPCPLASHVRVRIAVAEQITHALPQSRGADWALLPGFVNMLNNLALTNPFNNAANDVAANHASR